MQYDFTKVHQQMAERGLRLSDLQAKTGIHYTTFSKAFKRGTAHQTTAKALVKALRLSMKDIVVRRAA